MKKLFLLIVLFVFISGYTLFAQAVVITGTVTSSVQGEGPIPGVTVTVKGTTIGALTGVDGKYTLSAPEIATTLVFSYIGMEKQEVEIAGRKVIDVVLVPSISALGEIVVVGYGTQKKREVTSSITTVKSDEFNKGSVNSPVALIEGKVSGLSISKPGGNPNGTYDIRLRGMSTCLLYT